MTVPRSVILSLLSESETFDPISFRALASPSLACATSKELGEYFVFAAFLQVAIQFIGESAWLESKKFPLAPIVVENFLQPFFQSELAPIRYLESFLESLTLQEIKAILVKSECIETLSLEIILSRAPHEQKIFGTESMVRMSELFESKRLLTEEKKKQNQVVGYSLYRAFDRLDHFFQLDYSTDRDLKIDPLSTERLYKNSGATVQSGYSTILQALLHLRAPLHSRFVDLGSGFGRVGFTVGLVRPDMFFTGYESVAHRVDIANQTCKQLGLEKNVKFLQQDLSEKNFHLPDADIFYLYDPFSKETYAQMLLQVLAIGRRHKISVVTKGSARLWLEEGIQKSDWSKPRIYDDGNICLFESS